MKTSIKSITRPAWALRYHLRLVPRKEVYNSKTCPTFQYLVLVFRTFAQVGSNFVDIIISMLASGLQTAHLLKGCAAHPVQQLVPHFGSSKHCVVCSTFCTAFLQNTSLLVVLLSIVAQGRTHSCSTSHPILLPPSLA